MDCLEIKELTVAIHGQRILDGLSLVVPKGEVHAIMGPNGSGKEHLGQGHGWPRGL